MDTTVRRGEKKEKKKKTEWQSYTDTVIRPMSHCNMRKEVPCHKLVIGLECPVNLIGQGDQGHKGVQGHKLVTSF